jgi:hypothetical protein
MDADYMLQFVAQLYRMLAAKADEAGEAMSG